MADAHLREATTGDIGALSRLLVQLYAHELPGMLRGKVEAQVELARRGLLTIVTYRSTMRVRSTRSSSTRRAEGRGSAA
jgi:hypothetical protein